MPSCTLVVHAVVVRLQVGLHRHSLAKSDVGQTIDLAVKPFPRLLRPLMRPLLDIPFILAAAVLLPELDRPVLERIGFASHALINHD
jgi:hypothetical protein